MVVGVLHVMQSLGHGLSIGQLRQRGAGGRRVEGLQLKHIKQQQSWFKGGDELVCQRDGTNLIGFKVSVFLLHYVKIRSITNKISCIISDAHRFISLYYPQIVCLTLPIQQWYEYLAF